MAARRLKVILFVLLLCAPVEALAQRGAAKSQVRLRGRGQSIVLTRGTASRYVRRTIDVKEQINAARLDDVTLLLETRRGAFTYLLVDACGPSKLRPDARQCGAADECSLLWLKLDAGLKLSDIKSARYLSCWQSSSSTEGYKITGRQVRMEYDDFSGRKHYKLFYDAEQPERGPTLEESPLEN